jgi:aminopeptidase N
MVTKIFSLCAAAILLTQGLHAQKTAKGFTRADTLRGSLLPARTWWDVQHYDLTVKPDYKSKTILGKNIISYKVVQPSAGKTMQLDLQVPLEIDSIILDNKKSIPFKKDGNAWQVTVPTQVVNSIHNIAVYYQGKVHEAIRAPWDGGWIWAKDSLGRPWMTVACQGLGASVWFPCKDHQSDEPDKGARLTMIVPDTLVAIGNGRLQQKKNNGDGTATFTWAVTNPINNYCIIPYIGKYESFSEKYKGEKGVLDLTYWVLDYNLDIGKSYLPKEVHNTMKAFEHWFGPYPFYEDGYQLIETSHTGMEHQSAVSYGNWYKPGYRGRDGSGTGWGMKWDFIVIHESGHEWFGNNITTKDLADMWVHEGFTNYSETLFVEYHFGKDAGNAYNRGVRNGIRNDKTVIPVYNVNAQGSGDMYPKPSNMLHSIRHGLHDDVLFRNIIRGLNKDFYHQTVTSKQVENYINQKAKFNYDKVFDQYLRTTQIPGFEFYISPDKQSVTYRYINCVKGFNLPITLAGKENILKLLPTDNWKTTKLAAGQASLLTVDAINFMYYVNPVLLTEKPKQ